MNVAIYGLFQAGRCIYIGRTVNPKARLTQHKARFVVELGLNPEMKVLGWVAEAKAAATERRAIQEFRKLDQAEFNIHGEDPMFTKNIRLRSGQPEALARLSVQLNKTVSELIRLAVDEFLTKRSTKHKSLKEAA